MSRLNLDSLPTWRRVVIICGVAAACLIGSAVAIREFGIYSCAATAPNAATGEVFPVSVMHGYVRYLTAKDYEHLVVWRPLVGIPVLAVLMAMITSREFWRAID